MKKIKLNWITGKRLMERWNLDIRELHLCIQSGLPVYNPDFELEEWGPIYNKIPNPDYDPNDFAPQKYIVNQNNLHDLQVLLNTPFPVMRTGLTKDQILNNLLFKMEDVTEFEAKHGKDKKDSPDDNEKSEFAVYDSIVNGELRPFLEIYSSKKHIEKLRKKLWKVSLIPTEDGKLSPIPEGFDLWDISIKGGDEVEIEIDETDIEKPAEITNITQNELEGISDFDIPESPGSKDQYFVELIGLEYEKIKLRAKKFLETSQEETQISLYANKNIQIAKRIAVDAHILSKILKSREKKLDLHIIEMLKMALIDSIVIYQEIFEPYLKTPMQDEYQLRTFLYGEKPVQVRMRDFEERQRNIIYRNLSNEILTLKNGDDTKPYYDFAALKILTLTEKWLNTVSKEAVSNGFIGLSHLVFLMASDENYMKNSTVVQLCENVLSEIVGPEMQYSGPVELSTSDFKSRIEVWRVLLNRCVGGNFPWAKEAKVGQLYDTYLPLYCIDENTKELEKIDLRGKHDQLVHKALKGERSDLTREERVEISKFINKVAKFIKLSELERYFVDVIGIPLPSLLITEGTGVDRDPEDFVRNLRVSFENDNEIKIQRPRSKAKCITCQSLGFRNNKAKAWKTFIEILQNPPHTYYLGPSREHVQVYSDPDKIEGEERKLKYSEKGERKKSYDRRYKRLGEIHTKIVTYFNDRFPVQIPSDYKLYEQCSDDNTFKFKFQVRPREEESNKDKVVGEFDRLTEEYRRTKDPSLLGKINELALPILEREWLTNDEIENAIRPVQSHDHDTDKECSRKPRLPTAE